MPSEQAISDGMVLFYNTVFSLLGMHTITPLRRRTVPTQPLFPQQAQAIAHHQ